MTKGNLRLLDQTTEHADIEAIQLLHSFPRHHDTASEAAYIARFIDTIPGITVDGFGNRILKIGQSPILFSAHTDTVHKATVQDVQATTFKDGILSLTDPKPGYVLGADDGAGIWLLKEMIAASIPGLYIFHRGEEVGGLGSDYIAHNTPELLKGIDFAIAFDRKGTSDIITHQGSRTASDTFAQLFADTLTMGGFQPDDTGSFTDTANYSRLISECTNVSVGYEKAHSRFETLDVYYLLDLRDALLAMNWAALTAHRDPNELDVWDWQEDDVNYLYTDNHDDMDSFENLIAAHPVAATAMLQAYGVTEDEFLEELYRTFN